MTLGPAKVELDDKAQPSDVACPTPGSFVYISLLLPGVPAIPVINGRTGAFCATICGRGCLRVSHAPRYALFNYRPNRDL